MSTDKDFYDLLSSIAEDQTFPLDLSPRETAISVNCKQLSTSQLKELIKAAVDSPLTQAAFNTTASKVFKDSLVKAPKIPFNIIDRLLFIIETRIQSLSPTKTVEHEGKTIEISFDKIKKTLIDKLADNSDLFSTPFSATEGKITVQFGIPLLDTETQLNDELYKDADINVNNINDLRKVVGEAFVNEIAKSMQSITVGEKTLDLSSVSFKARLKTVETLPASLIQKVIEYIETYKKLIDSCLTINGYTIPVDSTLFSLR